MTHNDIRKKYIDFFVKRGHKEIPSAFLIPENDPSSLFTSSGMQPLITYLLGEKHPLGKRLVNSQKCFRAQDIEEVGDNRHTTFFEMLGNWSLGDYFKKEQLPWFLEFLTKELGLPKEKLAITVFEGNKDILRDEESVKIWKSLGIPDSRIFYYDVTKNWWSRSGIPDNMPTGEPGGPDSEVFFEFTDVKHDPKYGENCHPNCECGRFLEIGNSVFMEYQKQQDGSFKKLPQQNVDFGGGLERLVAATENISDIFQTDLYSQIIKRIYEVSGKDYSREENKPFMRVIADHIKAATFMVAEGLEPGNKQQGYILRRLLRRSAIKFRLLTNITAPEGNFIPIVESVLKTYEGTTYFKNITLKSLEKIIGPELLRFTVTLDRGLREVQKISSIDGKIAFDLYQTYGFPLEITAELFAQKGQKIDRKQFETEFYKHQELSRTASKGMFRGGLADQSAETTKLHTATHLLQQALRDVLGNHVRQKGSHITAKRLRFDFSHTGKLSEEEISKVESIVNEKIKENLKVMMEIVDFNLALKMGALTVEGATYPEKVKVYSIRNYSKEVCGGPHVSFTGGMGSFKIIKEEAISSNIRRIYAILL